MAPNPCKECLSHTHALSSLGELFFFFPFPTPPSHPPPFPIYAANTCADWVRSLLLAFLERVPEFTPGTLTPAMKQRAWRLGQVVQLLIRADQQHFSLTFLCYKRWRLVIAAGVLLFAPSFSYPLLPWWYAPATSASHDESWNCVGVS